MSSSGATEYKYWFEGLMPKQHEAVVNFLGADATSVDAEVVFAS